MNPACLSKIRKKHAAWKRYLETKSGEDYLKYTRTRNQARKATRKAQRDEEAKLAREVKRNPKMFWKHVHSKTKVKTQSQIFPYQDPRKKHQKMKKKQKFLKNISKRFLQ